MKLLATCNGSTPGSWALFHNVECDRRAWRAVVLTHTMSSQQARGLGTKRNYFFGWNGDRLSATDDFHTLRQHFPTVLDWLNATLPSVTWWEEVK